MSDKESIIERVKKLLALSTSSNPHEAATAAALANKLILQHALSQHELLGTSETPIYDKEPVFSTKRVTMWKYNLLMVLAKNYGCKVIICDKAKDIFADKFSRTETNYRLIGAPSDIEVIKYLFSYLTMMTEILVKLNSAQHKSDRSQGKIIANSYAEGIIRGIDLQLEASRASFFSEVKASNEQSKINALAVIDNKLSVADAAMKKFIPNVTYSRVTSHSKIDSTQFNNGVNDGKSIQINKAIGANVPNQLT